MTGNELIKKIKAIQGDGFDNDVHILDQDGSHYHIDSVQLDAGAVVLEIGDEVEEEESEEDEDSEDASE